MTLSLNPSFPCISENGTFSSFQPPATSPALMSQLPSQPSFAPCEVQVSESYDGLSTQGSSDSNSVRVTTNKTVNQSCNLYVASLPPECTDADLFALFAPFGPIVSAKAMCKKGLKECKGYGFVLFQREEDAIRAQSGMIGHMIGNNKIQVRRARATACTPLLDNRSNSKDGSSPTEVSSCSAGETGTPAGIPVCGTFCTTSTGAPPVYFQPQPQQQQHQPSIGQPMLGSAIIPGMPTDLMHTLPPAPMVAPSALPTAGMPVFATPDGQYCLTNMVPAPPTLQQPCQASTGVASGNLVAIQLNGQIVYMVMPSTPSNLTPVNSGVYTA